MRLLQRMRLILLSFMLAAMLPLGAAQAQVRAASVLDLTNARLLNADGTSHELPGIWYDLYGGRGWAHLLWADQHELLGQDEDYGRWSYGRCIGNCPSNYPPQDTGIPAGGYASARSEGAMWLGREGWNGSLQRAYVAATGPGISDASAGVSLLVRLQPEASESLVFAFDATPYMDLYRSPDTPPSSELRGGISLRISLFNVTTGQEVLQVADASLNRSLGFADGQPGTSLIYDPGTLPFAVSLGTLDPAYDYELRMVHSTSAWAVLAVPEPPRGALYLAGILVVGAFALRRRVAGTPV